MAQLVAAGGHRKELAPSGDLVGSAEDAQIRVSAELGLAPQHYRVGLTPAGWQIQPLAPTLVNGAEVTELTPLAPGDQITAGDLVLEFSVGHEETAPAPAAGSPPPPAAHPEPSTATDAAAPNAEGEAQPLKAAAGSPAPLDPLGQALSAAKTAAPKSRKDGLVRKIAAPLAAVAVLGGGAFAAWKSGLLPFGKLDAHFQVLADYAPAGSDFAFTVDIQDLGTFYEHWRPKVAPSLPALADASSKMRAEFGTGFEDYQRLSAVGASGALSSISPANAERAAGAVAVLLSLADGVDAETMLAEKTPGATAEDTGHGFTLYRIPDAKGLAARVIDGRHVLLTSYENHLEPPAAHGARAHVKTVAKSGKSLAISGAIPNTKFSGPMADSMTMPQSYRFDVDMPAGIDIAMGLDFASKEDAEKVGAMWEQMQGMAMASMGSDMKGEIGKALISKLQMKQKGSSQQMSISFSEGELAMMAEESISPAIADANSNPMFRALMDGMMGKALGGVPKPAVAPEVGAAMRDAMNVASIYSAAKAAGSPDLDDVHDALTAARKILAGVRGGTGSGFDNTSFQATIGEAELERAMPYLTWDASDRSLRYRAPGG